MHTKDLLKEVTSAKGKPHGYPRDLRFALGGDDATLEVEHLGSCDKKGFRCLDPWTLALLAEIGERCEGAAIRSLRFVLNPGAKRSKQFDLNFEGLRRRLSFLALNNPDLRFEVLLDGKGIDLYNKKSLLTCPQGEIIRDRIAERSEDGAPDFLEKAFQSFLFGKGIESRTNDRLAVLGEDFYQIKGKEVGILREFPTGAFDGVVSEATRVTPAEFIDFVTQNKWGNVALIELKVDNSGLEVISQILDYGLYFVRYRDQIAAMPEVAGCLDEKSIRHADVFCYVASNGFHPRFCGIQRFYHVGTGNHGLCLRRIALGETVEI